MSIIVGEDAYIDVEGANEYFNGRLYAEAWEAASENDKEKALKQATRTIDRLPLKGRPAYDDQLLAFPRSLFVDGTMETSERRFDLPPGWWTQSDIPQAVKDACCEEALALLERRNNQRRQLQDEGVTSFSIGNLSESYKTDITIAKRLHSDEAKDLLMPYIAGSVAII